MPTAFFWRGQTYRRKGDIDRAIEDFSRAIAQGPKNDLAPYFARGQLYTSKNDYARALTDFDAILAVAPDNAQAKQLRQSTQAMQAELAKAKGNDKDTPKPAPSPRASPSIEGMAEQAEKSFQQGGSLGEQLIVRARQLIAQAKYSDADLERLIRAKGLAAPGGAAPSPGSAPTGGGS